MSGDDPVRLDRGPDDHSFLPLAEVSSGESPDFLGNFATLPVCHGIQQKVVHKSTLKYTPATDVELQGAAGAAPRSE